ncbi:c5f17a28-72ee-41ff-ad3d-3f0557eae9fd [Sclerotinia trifoliorum]|uniref:C5f17a28-72ee-41ff-ad3d-3f0557eae9fd n=1 Tax=Sclerotinia trifoliorum TaxID=28548 RepID=A0A8H2ZQ07_9HELO|nr:c5f17a28-72ee-41ff-ad3d-3f0557eae9fd [Sclerotinia trifoliorum]
MESQENMPTYGSQICPPTPANTTSPCSPKGTPVGKLTRQSSTRTKITLPPSMTKQEFKAFSQQVDNSSLEEAKNHLHNLVPILPDPVEINNRKLVEQEENKIIQEENKNIRRDSVIFLKRRTSERKVNLATPTLKITTDSFRNSPALSPGASRTPPDSATPVGITPPILGPTSAINMTAASGTLHSNEKQLNQAHDDLITAGPEPAGVADSAMTLSGQHSATARSQVNERVASNVLTPSSGSATPASPRLSSMAQTFRSSGVRSAPPSFTGWRSNPYASNNGTPPDSAARAMGVYPWQSQGAGLPIPPVVPSHGQPVTLEWLHSAPIQSPFTSLAGSRETTPDLVYSNKELGHKKIKPEVPCAAGAGDAVTSSPQQ